MLYKLMESTIILVIYKSVGVDSSTTRKLFKYYKWGLDVLRALRKQLKKLYFFPDCYETEIWKKFNEYLIARILLPL